MDIHLRSWIESKETRDIIFDDWKDIGIGIVRNQNGGGLLRSRAGHS
jgi:uncharacterized protein YkwD